jgi:hypothetical protein
MDLHNKEEFSYWFQRSVFWSAQMATFKTAMETSYVSVWHYYMLAQLPVQLSRAVRRIALMDSG